MDQLQGIAPESVETFKRATEAFDAPNYEEAARLYAEVLKVAPDFTPALRRGGTSIAMTGRRDEGMALVERAATLERTPENFGSLAQVLGSDTPGHTASAAEKERALKLAVEANLMSSSEDPYYPGLVAQLALELEREEPFRTAVGTLRQKFPDVAAHALLLRHRGGDGTSTG